MSKNNRVSVKRAKEVLADGGYLTYLGGVYENNRQLGYVYMHEREKLKLTRTSSGKWMAEHYAEIHETKITLSRLLEGKT